MENNNNLIIIPLLLALYNLTILILRTKINKFVVDSGNIIYYSYGVRTFWKELRFFLLLFLGLNGHQVLYWKPPEFSKAL